MQQSHEVSMPCVSSSAANVAAWQLPILKATCRNIDPLLETWRLGMRGLFEAGACPHQSTITLLRHVACYLRGIPNPNPDRFTSPLGTWDSKLLHTLGPES